MRDQKTINRLVSAVRDALWTYPEMRLGQILVNATPAPRMIFYVSDAELLDGLTAYLDGWSEGKVPQAKRRVFISGPMTGYPDLNFPAFYAAQERFEAAGYDVVNPADEAQKMGLDVAYATGRITPEEYGRFMRQMTTHIAHCTDLALLPGWEDSSGARYETLVAQMCKLDLLHGEDGTRYDGIVDLMAGNYHVRGEIRYCASCDTGNGHAISCPVYIAERNYNR